MHSRALLVPLAAAVALIAGSAAAKSGKPQGQPCASPVECQSGFCADGVCCDSACNAPSCSACSVAAGATADGACTKLDGVPCDDHDPCTMTDVCKAGVCTGSDAKVCPAPPGGCADAVCDPRSDAGDCTTVWRDAGSPCDDGDVCTQVDTCQAGKCVGASPVVCPLQADCATAGICDPLTGCSTKVAPVCGPPPDAGPAPLLADGALCSSTSDCTSGFCVGGLCCDSPCTEACHSCALSGSLGKCVLEPEGVDLGHHCAPEGSCLATCGPTGQCIGSGSGTQCEPTRCIDDHRGLGPAYCPSEGAACPTAASAPFDCAPYLCQAATGMCAPRTCRSVHDCAPGHACDADHHCVRPPDVASGSDGGCGCRVVPGSPGPAAIWGLALVAALGRRRGGRGAVRAVARRVAALVAAVLAAVLAGCSGAPSTDRGLRDAFPDQAGLVLDRGQPAAASARGFHLGAAVPASGGAWSRVTADLPREGSDPVLIQAGAGLVIRVREIDAAGEGALAGRAVAYRRRGGTSFWTAGEAGVEEWIHAEPGAAAGGGALAVWEVEGASVRQRGSAIEIADAAGVARLRVTAPAAFAAGGRPIEARLQVSGARIELHVDPTGDAVLVDPAWAAIAPLPEARYGPTGALLPNGGAIISGGEGAHFGLPELRTSSIFDPGTLSWTPSASLMLEPQYGGFMTPLQTGKVFIAGGLNGNTGSATCEIYDPALDTWSAAASMPVALAGPGVVLLDHSVLLVGGPDAIPDSSASVERYDPATDKWSTRASMGIPRATHSATLLATGGVLVAGGVGVAPTSTPLASAEIYDPGTDSWKPAAPMHDARLFHTATRLPDGKVLVAGGLTAFGGTALGSAEVYDPGADTWTPAAPLAAARYIHWATPLADGSVLVVAGYDGTQDLLAAERFDPGSGLWLAAGSTTHDCTDSALVLLNDGSVLLAGGYDGVSFVDRFTPLPQGAACASSGECAKLQCVDGVCCDSSCTTACHACSKAKGATADGTCTGVTGPACADTNLCTVSATCVAGTCTAQTSVQCPSQDECKVGACDQATGVCAYTIVPDGMGCDDHDLCTANSTCVGGVCLGDQPIVCKASECNDAACNPQTGLCEPAPWAEGTPCDDHDLCTQDDTCKGGACTGGTPVVCVPQDACHAAGVCDPQTGCSNPVLPSCNAPPPVTSGATADGDLCGKDADCAHGHCVRGLCCESACGSPCFSCALAGARGKCTAEPEGIDLNQDCGAAANCVSTCGGDGTCVGAHQGTQCLPSRCLDDRHLLGPATCPYQGAPCPESESTVTDCAPYVCQAPLGACGDGCRTVADCAPGFVCNAKYQCTAPPDVAGGTDGACRQAPGTPEGGRAALLWLVALGALVRRRR